MALVYSCCFWFSLRLGGILIGLFSVLQGVLILSACCVGHSRVQDLKDEISNLMNEINLIYIKEYVEYVRQDPEKYMNYGITFTCIYIILCLFYIYGAYTCNNVLMIGYILMEVLRLLVMTVLVSTWLLVLKQNTMDIGLLIGASVAGGFLLLGMFYLWVCATNLPILINEMERDEQAATIAKLQKLLEKTNKSHFRQGVEDIPLPVGVENPYRRELYTATKNERKDYAENPFRKGSRIPVPQYSNNILR